MWLNLRGYFQYCPIFIRMNEITARRLVLTNKISKCFVHFFKDGTKFKICNKTYKCIIYLMQSISMAIKKGNAVCVRGCPKKRQQA